MKKIQLLTLVTLSATLSTTLIIPSQDARQSPVAIMPTSGITQSNSENHVESNNSEKADEEIALHAKQATPELAANQEKAVVTTQEAPQTTGADVVPTNKENEKIAESVQQQAEPIKAEELTAKAPVSPVAESVAPAVTPQIVAPVTESATPVTPEIIAPVAQTKLPIAIPAPETETKVVAPVEETKTITTPAAAQESIKTEKKIVVIQRQYPVYEALVRTVESLQAVLNSALTSVKKTIQSFSNSAQK